MFRSLFRRSLQSPSRLNDDTRRRSRLGLECLESREVPAFFTVTSNLDIPVDKSLTLREAITKANESGPGVHYINFALESDQTVITLRSQLPTITEDVYIFGTLIGPGTEGAPPVDNRITIQRHPEGDQFRLLEVGEDTSATLVALKLMNGYSLDSGGAILSEGDNLGLIGCEVRGNHARHAGGGIAVLEGILHIEGSAINGNSSASRGGGVYFDGIQMTMFDSVVGLNFANASGGGIYLNESNQAMTVTLDHVEIAGNIADRGDGGGVWSNGSKVHIEDGTHIHNNTAANNGGGLYVFGGHVTFDGVVFNHNDSAWGSGIYARFGCTLTYDPLNDSLVLNGGDVLFWGP